MFVGIYFCAEETSVGEQFECIYRLFFFAFEAFISLLFLNVKTVMFFLCTVEPHSIIKLEQLIIINEEQQILCQRDDPKFDIFNVLEVSMEDVQHIRFLLKQTSVQNNEISLQIKAKVENDNQMYHLKLHTLWSPLKKDGYIGIVGYFDSVK